MQRTPRPMPINPAHQATRDKLRKAGKTILPIGIILTVCSPLAMCLGILGLLPPELVIVVFMLGFVGMPLLFVGGVLLMLGYQGKVARYQAQEMAPVATDTLNYMAEGTREGVKTTASAVAEGLREGFEDDSDDDDTPSPLDIVQSVVAHKEEGAESPVEDETSIEPGTVTCRKCQTPNDVDARFCKECGDVLPRPKTCIHCRTKNDADAKFCDNCGKRLY